MSADPSVTPPPPSATSPVTLGLLFVLGISFAVAISLNRFASDGGVPFAPYVFWQSLGGGVALSIATVALRRVPRFDFPHIRIYLTTGALNLSFPYLLLAFLAPKVPASLLTIGLSLVPVMIYALALILRLDRFHVFRFGGILLGLAGVLLVLLPQASLPAPGMAGWVALGLLPSLSYAVNAVLVARWRPAGTTSLPLAAGLMLASAGFILIVMAATGEWWAFDGAFGIGHGATIAAMANNCVSFYLIFEIIRRAGPVIFSTVNYIATLSGMGFGIWFFGDAPSAWIWGAIVLMFAGLFLVTVVGQRSAPK
jgi:drug/metabolite transporter (DMT)-like permease